MNHDIELVATKLIKLSTPLFAKIPNTFYLLRFVKQPFNEKINVFFEWGRIGSSTTSRHLMSLPMSYEPDLDHLAKIIHKQTNLNVEIN